MHLLSRILLKRVVTARGFDRFNMSLLWADIEEVPYSAKRHSLRSVDWGPFFAQRRAEERNAALKSMSVEEIESSWGSQTADHYQVSRLPDEFLRLLAQTPPNQANSVMAKWCSREDIGLTDREIEASAPALEKAFANLQQLAALALRTRCQDPAGS
jgi:hypothetical protein